MYEGAIQDLIDELGRLPGVGPKSAQRIAFHVLSADPADVTRLANALRKVKEQVRFCTTCFNVAESEQCRVCRDTRRGNDVLCVVEEPKDVVAIERTGEFRGRYHVLGGAINPLEGIGPDNLRIRELMIRLGTGEVKELILATDPNTEARPRPPTSHHGQADGHHRHPAGQRTSGRRRPGVRRRDHPRPSVRGPQSRMTHRP